MGGVNMHRTMKYRGVFVSTHIETYTHREAVKSRTREQKKKEVPSGLEDRQSLIFNCQWIIHNKCSTKQHLHLRPEMFK